MSDATRPRTQDLPPDVLAEVERARAFLRDIRSGVAAHAVAGGTCRIFLHERRTYGITVLRLSGTLDGALVDLHIEIPDEDPTRAQVRYSGSLTRLRDAAALGPGVSAFMVAHDRAFEAHYGIEHLHIRELRRAATLTGARGRPGLH